MGTMMCTLLSDITMVVVLKEGESGEVYSTYGTDT
jgi:hypothetical protein